MMTEYQVHPTSSDTATTIERIGDHLSIVSGHTVDRLDVAPGHITITMPNELKKTYYVNFRMKCYPGANQGRFDIWDSDNQMIFSFHPNSASVNSDSSGGTRAVCGLANDSQSTPAGNIDQSSGSHNPINDHQRRSRSRSPSYVRLREAPAMPYHSPSKTDSGRRRSRAEQKCQVELGFCQYIMTELIKPEFEILSYPFKHPVDPVAMNLPTYPSIIKKPMDLGNIGAKLKAGEYRGMHSFEADIRLIFSNCQLFNPPSDPVYSMGREYEAVFDWYWAKRKDWIQKHA